MDKKKKIILAVVGVGAVAGVILFLKKRAAANGGGTALLPTGGALTAEQRFARDAKDPNTVWGREVKEWLTSQNAYNDEGISITVFNHVKDNTPQFQRYTSGVAGLGNVVPFSLSNGRSFNGVLSPNILN